MPISAFQYRQTASLLEVTEPEEEEVREPEVRLTESEFRSRLAGERAAGVAETEARLRNEIETRAQREMARVTKALTEFETARKEYFSSVEVEVVKLALAIAGKILHREAQVDPLLVAALVQIALGQLKEGAAATIRVRPEDRKRWLRHFEVQGLKLAISIEEDMELEAGDCVLQTEMGTVNFSLEGQLKEVERGFFDVLAHRPNA
jgi:flagellar assembly protein FliH